MSRLQLALISLGLAFELAAVVLLASGSRPATGLALMVVGLAIVVIAIVAGRRRPPHAQTRSGPAGR